MLRDSEDSFSGFDELPSQDGDAGDNLTVTGNPFGVTDEVLFPQLQVQQQLNHSFPAFAVPQMPMPRLMPMPQLPVIQRVAFPAQQSMMQQPAQLMPKSVERKETKDQSVGASSSSSASSSSAFAPEVPHTEKEHVEMVRLIAAGKKSEIRSAVAKYYSDKIPPELSGCLKNLSEEQPRTELLLFFANKLKHSWVVGSIPQIRNILSSEAHPRYNMDHLVEDSFGDEDMPQELQETIDEFKKCRRQKTALPERGELARLFIANQADNPKRPKAKSKEQKEGASGSKKRTNAEAGLPQAAYASSKDEKAADFSDDEDFAPLPKRAQGGSNRTMLQKLLAGQQNILERLSGEDTEKLKARNRELEDKAATQAATIRSLTAENNILRGKVEAQDAVLAYLEAAARQVAASAAPAAMASSVAQGLPALPSAMGYFASTQLGGSLQNLPSQQGSAQPHSFAQDPALRFKS